ncbi:MAG: SPOR domain-containing protein [Steroidobacteraceae bacterium]|jgi:DedD protein
MMDRRLKERLVGATILVALIVLIVPELLSGPKHPALPPLAAGLPAAPSRSVVVDLDTRKAIAEPESGAASQAAPAEAPNAGAASAASGATEENAASAEPPPASAPSVATLKAQTAAQAPLETPASAPKLMSGTPRSAPVDTPATPRHDWAVQLGSFARRSNADRLVHRLQGTGGSFYVVSGGSGSSLRYRVRMGPLADRSAAERALAKLKAQGHPATIVTPAS